VHFSAHTLVANSRTITLNGSYPFNENQSLHTPLSTYSRINHLPEFFLVCSTGELDPTRIPETSVNIYQLKLCNIPELRGNQHKKLTNVWKQANIVIIS